MTHHRGSLVARERAGEEFLEIAQVIDVNLVALVVILSPSGSFRLMRPGGALHTYWKL